MKTVLFYLLTAGVLLLPCYLWYWHMFRPVVITRLRFRLFALRDKLRMRVVEASLSPDDKHAYPLVEAACNRAINATQTLTMADLFLFKADKSVELATKRDMALIEKSSKELRDIRSSTLEIVLAAMLVNSPGFIVLAVPLSFLILGYYWFHHTRKSVEKWRERLWEVVASDSNQHAPTATC